MDNHELAAVSVPPKSNTFAKINAGEARHESKFYKTKMRWSKINTDGQQTMEDTARVEEERGEIECERIERETEEESHREIFNEKTKTLD